MTSEEIDPRAMELFLDLVEISGLHASGQYEAALQRSRRLLDRAPQARLEGQNREIWHTAMASSAALAFDSAMKLGDYKGSHAFAEREVSEAEAIGGVNYPLVVGLNNRGLANLELGNLLRAEKDFQHALELAARLDDDRAPELKSLILSNLANLQTGRLENEEANNSLLVSAIGTGSTPVSLTGGVGWWNSLNNLATVASNAGDYDQAIKYYEQILERAGDHELSGLEQGIVLCNLGMVLSNKGRKEEGIARLKEASEIHRNLPGSQVALATDLYNLGLIYIQLEQLENAIPHFKEAWDVIRVTSHRSILVLQILRWLAFCRMMQKDHDRARAILLKGLEIYEAFRPDIAGSEKGQEGSFDIYRALIEYLLYLAVHDGLSDQAMMLVERAKARYWLERTAQQKREIRKHTGASRLPDGGNLADQMQDFRFVADAGEVKDLSGRDTLILNFFVGREALFICYAFNRSFGATRIDLREEQLWEMIEEFRSDLMSSSRRAGKSPIGKELSNRLLGRVLDPEWNCRYISIMPDGVLWYLPFEALPVPDVLRDREANRYFGDLAPVSYAPTSTVLKVLYQREERLSALDSWNMLIVTNPGASEGFSSLQGVVTETETLRQQLGRVAATRVLSGTDATPENLLGSLPGCSHLHISSHAIAEIDLSEPYIRLHGADSSAGNLYSSRIGEINMHADLVFLSACSTALGKKSAGEGLMSLGRAFLLAGCRCVVASLWPIRDEEAPDFIGLFYKHLLIEKSTARALLKARVEFRDSGGSPRTWAAFQALGDGDRRVDRHRVLDVHPWEKNHDDQR